MSEATSLHTRIVSRWLFPLHERLKGHDSPALLHQLEASQWWSPQRVQALQLERLRAFLVHAGRHVPYYRRLFAETGFDPLRVDSVRALRRLPCLSKPIIRAQSAALRSETAGALKRYTTGGSSGEPLTFYIGKARISHDVAAKWRATRWWGVDIGDPEVVLWGSPIEIGAQDRLRGLRDRVLRSTLLPAFEMSEVNLDRFIAQIRRLRPRMLFGYPTALALVAQHARTRGVRVDNLGIRVAFVTAEQLYPEHRACIEQGFNCAVANGYGGRDAGFIAHQCQAGGLHISAEDIVVEVIGEDGQCVAPGLPGEVVVTHLATRDFPFVRYRTGDIGILDARPCPCGRGLPVIREIVGRSTDYVIAQDGTRMPGTALTYVLREMPEIAAFKIVQETRELLRVQVVPAANWSSPIEESIRAGLRARLGRSTEVVVEVTDRIPPERSGKYRYIVSHVA
jgi:phenylacetate-CoA ligase